jgi:hypothetical protein
MSATFLNSAEYITASYQAAIPLRLAAYFFSLFSIITAAPAQY